MTSRTTPFLRLNIRAKILLVLLALSLVTLIITGILAWNIISDVGAKAEASSTFLGRTAVEDSSNALKNTTEQYLIQMVTDQASITDLLIWIAESEMRIARSNALAIQDNPSYTPVFPIRPAENPPADPRSASVYYFAPGSQAGTGTAEFKALTGMSDIFHGVLGDDPDLTSIYAATDSGMMLAYPGELPVDPDYDPRQRTWYTDAVRKGNVTWTGPYVDATGKGLVLTCSVPVYSPRYGYWVIASDMTLNTINNDFLNWTIGESGYVVLMDDKGNIISRPGLSAGGTQWYETYHTENVFDSSDPRLRAVGSNMTEGKTGIGLVGFNGTEKFVAYAPVELLNWSIGISLPVSEVVAPAVATETKIIGATQTTREEISQETAFLGQVFMVLIGVILVIIVILSVLLAKIITRPVEALKAGTLALGKGELDYHVDIRSGDEFEDLADSFNRMAFDLKRNIADLERTTAEKERYAKEMEIAKSIQQSFLPESVPDIPGFDIAAFTLPAMEIGGDFYDFIEGPDNREGFVIADVSGKGVSAALFMAISRTLVHASGGVHPDPGSAIRRANRLIQAESRASMFVTLFYGVLDPATRLFAYVNAGHNPPLLVRNASLSVVSLEERGIALGVLPEIDLGERTVSLSRGDCIVMYTDGVTEAINPAEEVFGEDRLNAFIRTHSHLPAREIISLLLEEIHTFSNGAPQADDITIVIIRVAS